MRLPSGPADAAILSTVLFPLLAAAVGSINCDLVIAGKDRTTFNLHELGGPRSVVHRVDEGPSYTNTTYTIDICKPLGKVKHVKADDQCPNGTRLCAIQHQISEDGDSDILKTVFPIAGELIEKGGGNLDSKWQLLKESTSHEDSAKEGLILEMNGGFKNGDGGKKRKQKAIVEFLCDAGRTGLEHLPTPEDPYEEAKKKRVVEDKDSPDNSGEEKPDDNQPSLEFLRYDTDGTDADVLRLRWRTKYACPGENPQAEHWGLFTWFLIIAFMSTASYLIFGSWLNYNRYGARGWDLLPHGDTIRDVPYLLKDWFRRVLNTVQGGGSRGGYAAV